MLTRIAPRVVTMVGTWFNDGAVAQIDRMERKQVLLYILVHLSIKDIVASFHTPVPNECGAG
jgi:hypothetical protein